MLDLGTITLKDGSRAEVLRVTEADKQWTPKVSDLLGHKPDSFRWANELMLSESLGIEVYFYVVVVDDLCVANIKTMEFQGVGILGDVYTRPEYRGRGVASQLMQAQMNDFKARGGQALYLGTGYDTHPFRMYAKFGFNGIEENSGTMTYFGAPTFADEYFAKGAATIRALDWRHYPTSAALFTAPIPGVVRCLPLNLIGRRNSEGSFLEFLKKSQNDATSCGGFGLQKANGALVGFAMWDCDPNWPDVARVDVFCHPNFWEYGPELLNATLRNVPDSKRGWLAYCDSQCPQKSDVLQQAGFSHSAIFERWVQVAGTRVDVHQYVMSNF